MAKGVPCAPGQIPCIPVRVRLPIAGCCEVAVRGHSGGTKWVNTHAYNLGGGVSLANLQSVANAVIATVIPAMQAMMNSTDTFDDVRVSDFAVPTGVSVVLPLPPNTHGNDGNPPLPTNAAAVMSYKSGAAGRSHNGRQYNTGLSTDSAVGDTLVPAYMVLANNAAIAWNTIRPALTAAQPVVASITKGIFTFIISHIMDSYIDSRRRRLIKG